MNQWFTRGRVAVLSFSSITCNCIYNKINKTKMGNEVGCPENKYQFFCGGIRASLSETVGIYKQIIQHQCLVIYWIQFSEYHQFFIQYLSPQSAGQSQDFSLFTTGNKVQFNAWRRDLHHKQGFFSESAVLKWQNSFLIFSFAFLLLWIGCWRRYFFLISIDTKWLFFSKNSSKKNNKNGKKILKDICRRVSLFSFSRILVRGQSANNPNDFENQQLSTLNQEDQVMPVLINMLKAVALIFALAILASAGGQSGLTFQLGNNLASLTRSGSRYNGVVNLGCQGGQGAYRFNLSGLPAGWSADGNAITIPNIVNVVGAYVIRARVTDEAGNVLEGDIRLVINGVNVVVQSSNGNTDNNIQYSTVGGFVPSGDAGSGFPNGGAGFPNGGAPGAGFPNGGAPGAGFPNGGAPGAGSAPSVAPLYENYPGLPSGSAPSVPAGGRYPTAPSPSGNPSTPNIVPSVIASAQAPYNPARDAKPVTVDDVKRNAAFNRQLNANKAVANLISIIQQLTANVNAAKNDIGVLQNQLTAAEGANTDCNNKIYDLSNTRTKIQNAIKDRQDRITEANKKIAELAPVISDLTKTRDNLVDKRTELENARSPNAAKLADLTAQQKDCTNGQTTTQKQIDDLNAQIAGLNSDIKRTQDDAASAPGAIDLIDQQVPIIDGRIADLQRQLDNAQREKAKLLQDKLKYQQAIEDANRKVRDLQRAVDDLKNRIPALQNQLAALQGKCDAAQKQIDDLRNQISQKESDYKTLVDQIKAQDGLIADKKDQARKLADSIAGLPAEIAALQQELARVEESIRRQYYICNDAADSVRKAKQNLDALNNKYNTESGWLRDANNNLEKARAEKELADQGVQEIISVSTSALPFSIVPNGNGQTPAGTPAGNNPSGSPLGPVADRNQVVPGSPVVVGDLGNYLSQAYGAGVDPTKPSTVTTLYPISGLTLQALTGQSASGVFNPDGTFVTGGVTSGVNTATTFPVSGSGQIGNAPYGGGNIPSGFLSSFSCNGSNGLTQGSGRVVSVQPGQLVVNQDGGSNVVLNVAPCSNLNAVQPNYAIVPQARVYYKGTRGQGSHINLQQLTCV